MQTRVAKDLENAIDYQALDLIINAMALFTGLRPEEGSWGATERLMVLVCAAP